MQPSLSGTIPSVAEADQLLETLDQLAHGQGEESEFLQQCLMVVRALTGAIGTAILYPARGSWLTAAQMGPVDPSHLVSAGGARLTNPGSSILEGFNEQGEWVASPVETSKLNSALLVIVYPKGTDGSFTKSGRLFLEPFCEILRTREATSRSSQWQRWHGRLEETIRAVTQSASTHEANQILVDQLVLSLEGVRASLVRKATKGRRAFHLTCSSGSPTVDRTSPTVKKLEQLAQLADSKGEVLQWRGQPPLKEHGKVESEDLESFPNRDESGIFSHGLVFPWEQGSNQASPSWVIVEWADDASMQKALPWLSSWCSVIYPIWLQQKRWTQVSTRVRRRLSKRPNTLLQWISIWVPRLLGLGLAIAALWGLTVPYPMTIESDATLEPVSRRLIHASADGFITELLVEDGEHVIENQELARLTAPSLDLQIEEVVGQLRAISEKRNGLRVAINQLSPNDADSLANQTRLSTELLMLDSQESQAKEMLEFYRSEQSRLVLRSPIDGVIVSKQLRQELENRPIRRGDPLLQVVDLSGEWQLSIQVADRDSYYVGQFYDSHGGKPANNDVEYSFDSLPSERFTAHVTELAPVIENRQGQGGFQEILARVDREDATKAHMGATARVRFACGQQTFAFVWSRPLVEFVQKRFRIFSWLERSTNTPNTDAK